MTPVDVKETRAFDAKRRFKTRSGREILGFVAHDDGFTGLVEGTTRCWFPNGKHVNGKTELDLVNWPDDPAPPAGGVPIHDSDCAVHNAPALPVGPCDCSVSRGGGDDFDIFADVDEAALLRASLQTDIYNALRPHLKPHDELGQGTIMRAILAELKRTTLLPTTGEGDAVAWQALPCVLLDATEKGARMTASLLGFKQSDVRPLYRHPTPAPRHDGGTVDEAAVIAKACKPWEFCIGDVPDYGSPLHNVFVAGMLYSEKLLAEALGVENFERGDGSEDFDTDATITLINILTAAGLWDAEENRPVAAHPAQHDHAGGEDDAIRDVVAERRRQIKAEGWTPEHDDAHDEGQLADAAACYASHFLVFFLWPWRVEWWKPSTRRRDLVKAGALILAEIQRLDRLARKGARS